MRSFVRNAGAITAAGVLALGVIFTGVGCDEADYPPAPALENNEGAEQVPIVIEGFNPARALPGDQVTITGSGFRDSEGLTEVYIGGAGAEIVSLSTTEVVVNIPVFAGTAQISVEDTWGSRAGTSETELEIAVPVGLAMGSSGDAGAPLVTSDDPTSMTLAPGATTHTIAGDITGSESETGYWAILDADGFVRSAGVLPQTGDRYSQTLPMFCGSQGMTMYFDNSNGRGFYRGDITRVDCEEPGIRVKLSWDTDGTDVDLHLLQPGGAYATSPGDCYFANSNPDWGIEGEPGDNPELDVDDTNGYGPENIYVDPSDDGDYRVIVHYWSDHGEGPSNAWLEVFVDGARVNSFGPFNLTASGVQWSVCSIGWPGGALTQNY